MQPDIGFILACSPQCGFWHPRSYVKQLAITAGGYPSTLVDRTFTLFVGSPLIYTQVITFRENWWNWSSNCYTLDYIVETIQYFTPGGPLSPAGCNLSWFPNDDPPTPSIEINLVSTGLPYTYVTLPPAPAGYWAG